MEYCVYIKGVLGGIVNISGGGSMDYCIYTHTYIQDISGGIVNILGGGSMGYSIYIYIYRVFQEE